MRRIVRYAYENVPFYHRLLKEKLLKPDDIRTLDDLQKIPIVTRKDIQNNLNDMISTKINRAHCVKKKTSGSSGVPLLILRDNDASNFKSAVSLRQFLECGGKLRDKQLQLRERGASSLPENLNKPFYEPLGFLRTEWVKTGEILDGLVPYIKAYRPDVLIGYPGFLQLLAEKMKSEVRVRIIFSTGEILSKHCRHVLSSSFGAKIIDSYGCAEAGDIAWECPEGHQGYHMNVDSVLTEFVQDGEAVAAGEDGEIVLTNLFSFAMPFIRYKIGDVGVPIDEKCSCGRTLPLMRILKGRSDDFIILPNGKRLSPLGMVNIQCFVGIGVAEMMIVQKDKNLIEVWLKTQGDYEGDRLKTCLSTLQKILGPDVHVCSRFVNEIPRNGAGKVSRVISKVAT